MLHGMQDLSSLTRDRTRVPYSGSMEYQPLDCQGNTVTLPFFFIASAFFPPSFFDNLWSSLL